MTEVKLENKIDLHIQKNSAIVGAIALLVMTLSAPFSYMYVLPKLIVWNDAALTISNIFENQFLFRMAVVGFIITIIADIIVAWAFYNLFASVNRRISLLTAWFRIIYSVIFAVSLTELVNVVDIINSADLSNLELAVNLQTQIMFLLKSFEISWNSGYPIFSLHLGLLGWLLFKSKYFPKILGMLVGLAGLGYMIDSIGKIMSSSYNANVAMFTFAGEPLLIFFLFWMGFRGFKKGHHFPAKEVK